VKITPRQPQQTADISAGRGTAGRELALLAGSAFLLLAGLYFAIGWVVDAAVTWISYEREAKLLGKADFVPDGRTPKPGLEERPRKVLEKLIQDPAVPPLPYSIKVIEMPEPNVFAFPGGTIGVTTGLLDQFKEEVELGFVIGHELGHFKNRDHLRSLGRAVGMGVVTAVVFGGEMGDVTVTRLIPYVLERRYSRQQEDLADRFGVQLVRRVYGRSDGIDKLFQILKKESAIPGWAYMFSTHPAPESRIDALREYARQLE
jgi:Zn-dependent protease with chaperone function